MDDACVADDEGFFIGRVKRNLFEQSYVGAIFTDGNPSPGFVGTDLRRGRAPGDVAIPRAPAQLRRRRVRASEERRPATDSTDDWSYGFSASYPNDKFDAQIAFREIQRELPSRARVRPARQRAAAARRRAATIRGRGS